MTPSPKPGLRPGTKLEWLALPKRPCDYCGNKFQPKRPQGRFCKPECNRAFHHHGGSYAKLLPQIGREIANQIQLREPCPQCKNKPKLREACKACDGRGTKLTKFARQFLDLMTAELFVLESGDLTRRNA